MTPEQRVLLREYGRPVETSCSPVDAMALRESGLVDVRRGNASNAWVLTPAGKVGTVRAGPITVTVQPKVPIHRLLFLLEYAPDRATWQHATVPLAPDADLLTVIASAFVRSCKTATKAGLLQGYSVREDSLTVLRGRVRENDQMRQQQGRVLPLEVRFDEFTVDIPENQILLLATSHLLRLPSLTTVRTELKALRQRFSAVSSLNPGAILPRWTPTRLNQHYQSSLSLAELVLKGMSFAHQSGEVQVSGFVLDMPRVFQDFLAGAMRALCRANGWVVQREPQTPFDEAAMLVMRPDILLTTPAGRTLAVVDAKYKAERPTGGYPLDDAYQAHAYATALGLPEAHLVYAKGNEHARSYTIRGSQLTVTTHALDLSLSPPQLLRSIAQLADRIMTPSTVTTSL